MSALIRFSHVHGIEYKLGEFLFFFYYFTSYLDLKKHDLKNNEYLTKIKTYSVSILNTPH